MKTLKLIVITFLFAGFSGCNGQTPQGKTELAEAKRESTPQEDSAKPRIDVKVNKQYDNKGNIIRFDSTYTYIYSGPKGSLHLENDSVFRNFRSFFEGNYPNLMDRHHKNIFFNDSLFKYDFFNDDYFQKRFQLNEKMFENMFQQMDSIKRNYLKQNYPKGYQKKNTINKLKSNPSRSTVA